MTYATLHVLRTSCNVCSISGMSIHYDLTGNTYWNVASTGFCGATSGTFTISRSEVTCPDCTKKIG